MPCRLREAWHFTLPEAVTLKRFLAPLLVFNLGIWLPLSWSRRGSPKRQRAGGISDEWKAGEPPRHAPPGGSSDAPYRVDLSGIARPAQSERLNAARAPSPSADLRAYAPTPPLQWSRCRP